MLKNIPSLKNGIEIDDTVKYKKYWDDVANGKYDIPYGMTSEEYAQYLKGLDKVDKAVKGSDDVIKGGSKTIEINNVEIINSKGVPLGELDGLDLKNGIIYEDKTVKGLDIINPKTGKPQQTAQKWANKQIYEKTKNRISNINDAVDTKLPGGVSIPEGSNIPSIEQIKDVKNFVFRLEGDSPELREAMTDVLVKLSTEFPDYTFKVEYTK